MAIEGLTSRYHQEGIRLHTISEQECETILKASFRVLEEVGMDIKHERARALLASAGCSVEGERVKIPRELVIRSINTAGKELVLYDRLGNEAFRAGGTNVQFGLGPTNPFTCDFETGERRPSRRQDVVNAAIVADACPNIDFVMGLAQINDEKVAFSDVIETREMLNHTTKPIIYWGVEKEGMDLGMKMCDAVAGSHEAFLERPFAAAFPGCPITPLTISGSVYEKIETSVLNGMQIIWASGAQLGSVTPVTLAGAFSVNLSEVFAGIVLTQLLRPGSVIACGVVVLTVDMAPTGSAYGSPEHCLGEGMCADLFHYLNLPMFQTGGVTDSKLVDEQSAIECSMQVLTNMMAGGNMVHDVGFIESAMSGSLDQIVLSDEIIGYAKRMHRGVSFDEESLAFEAIREVGPGGEFLTHEHTAENFREELWQPSLIERKNFENWSTDRLDMRTRIHQKTARILACHQPKPLAEDAKAKVDALLEAYMQKG